MYKMYTCADKNKITRFLQIHPGLLWRWCLKQWLSLHPETPQLEIETGQ